MLTTLLSLVLVSQVAESSRPVPPPPPLIAAPRREAEAGTSGVKPAAPDRQAQLKALNERRRVRHARALAARDQAVRQFDAAVANNSANAAAELANLRIRQQEAAALEGMAQSSLLNAQVNRSRYILQTQQAGVPQVFVPGQGLVPYAYGIASPLVPPMPLSGGTAPLAPVAAP